MKFNLPASLLGDREAFIEQACRAASETAREAAETLWATEVAPEPERAVEPSPSPVLTPIHTSPPSGQPKYEECLSCQ